LHIPPNEARVFQTKERAPVLLAIEVFRPDEMALVLQEKNNLKTLKNLGKMPDNPYLNIDDLEDNSLPVDLFHDA
jgi:hypothetical protein